MLTSVIWWLTYTKGAQTASLLVYIGCRNITHPLQTGTQSAASLLLLKTSPKQLNEWHSRQNMVFGQWLLRVVAKQHRLLPNDIIFRKIKCFTFKYKDWWLCKWSLVEIGYTLDFYHFDVMYVSRYLNIPNSCVTFHFV